MARIVVGITGASGIILGIKALRALAEADYEIELVITKSALLTAKEEDVEVSIPQGVRQHAIQNFGASIASGTYKTEGMLIIPCSMATLGAVALGLSDNLLRRAADVVLKERRKLVIVPREAPFSTIHLDHMALLSRMGAVICPPIPAWYTRPKTVDDIENFIVGRALDALGVSHTLYLPWRS